MTVDLPALRGEIRRKDTTPQRLLEIAALDPQLSRSVAKAKTTPPDVLARLASSSDMPTRTRVAENPNAPAQALAHLASDPQWTVLKAVAEHPQLPAGILLKLSRHKRSTVRAAAVKVGLERGLFSPDDLREFLADPAGEVRLELAAWDGLDTAQADAFLHDPAASVRHTILCRSVGAYTHNFSRAPAALPAPLTTAQVLPLLDDEDGSVRLYALRVLDRLDFDFLSLPLTQRQKLARDEDGALRGWVLDHWSDWFAPSTPAEARAAAEILTELASSPTESVRAEVAWLAQDPALIRQMAQDESADVRAYLFLNPQTPHELLRQVADGLDNPLGHPFRWGRCSGGPLLTHPNLTDTDWAELLADGGPLARLTDKVALSWVYRDFPETWEKITRFLVKSTDPTVLAALVQWSLPADVRRDLKAALERHAPQLLPDYQKKYER